MKRNKKSLSRIIERLFIKILPTYKTILGSNTLLIPCTIPFDVLISKSLGFNPEPVRDASINCKFNRSTSIVSP